MSISERLHALCTEYDVPGASVAVLSDGRETHATYGVLNRRTRVETTPDSLFMIQSITKVWTATLIMQLIADGLVDLERPVRAYLPEFHTDDPRLSAEITVRHLLTHTGGFEGDLWVPTTPGTDALERLVTDVVPQARQVAQPGTLYSYCSAGMAVLGRIVEVLRGLPYEDAFRRFLAEPLDIGEIAFDAGEALAFRTAIGHVQEDGRQCPVRHWAVMPASNAPAGNQLAMSARSLLGFGRMHLSDGLGPNGTRVLTAETARAMRTPQVSCPAGHEQHGLGWSLRRAGVVEHFGNTIGSDALLRLVPERQAAVAVLTNGGRGGSMAHVFANEILGLEAEPPLPTPPPTPLSSGYAGTYENRISRAEVTGAGGLLRLTLRDQGEALEVSRAAGVDDPEPEEYEMRRERDEVFVLLNDGHPVQRVEFIGTDPPRFLHMGRALARVRREGNVVPGHG